MKKVLIIGKRGQLGSYLMRQDFAAEVISFGRDGIDLSQTAHIYDWLLSTKADVIINAAAYTKTAQAESEPGDAECINVDAVHEMAKAAKALSAMFVHVSTDYVFDGESEASYTETSPTNPINVYGRTKLEGENLALEACDRTLIFRTSWIFSEIGENFFKAIIRMAKEREVLEVVSDQFGSPTFAGHLAQQITTVVNRYLREEPVSFGVYHYTDKPSCSWQTFAVMIIEKAKAAGIDLKANDVNAILSKDWPSKVNRPKHAVLDCSAVYRDFGLVQLPFEKGVDEVIQHFVEKSTSV